MNLFELFIKIGVDDQASGQLKSIDQKLGNGLKTAAKIGTAAVGTASAAITALTTQAVKGFAEYEQLAGGAQKIFDQMDYSKIANDASNAYKELGLSASQYLAVINDVGATFAATMGDEAGYEAAKTGLKAISDYASGTGKNVDELSQKFTLITRSASSYQSIADQFSGILPATSDAFLEQAQAANVLSGSYTKLTEVPIDEYQAAVSQMLEQGVKELGLFDNTVNEAFSTLSGSLAMSKGAWSNLVTGLADDTADFDVLVDRFVESAAVATENVLPRIEQVIVGSGELINALVPVIIENVPAAVQETLPTLLEAGVTLLNTILDGIAQDPEKAAQTMVDVVFVLVDGAIKTAPKMLEAGARLLLALIVGIIKAVPEGIKRIPEATGAIVDSFDEIVPQMVDVGANIINGIWRGIKNNLASIKQNIAGGVAEIKSVFTGKGGFDVHSPSKWSEDLFENVMKGIPLGMEKGKSAALSAITSFADQAKGGFGEIQTAQYSATGGYVGGSTGAGKYYPEEKERQFTINLMLPDGRKLASYIFSPLAQYAAANGTPIINPA